MGREGWEGTRLHSSLQPTNSCSAPAEMITAWVGAKGGGGRLVLELHSQHCFLDKWKKQACVHRRVQPAE